MSETKPVQVPIAIFFFNSGYLYEIGSRGNEEVNEYEKKASEVHNVKDYQTFSESYLTQ